MTAERNILRAAVAQAQGAAFEPYGEGFPVADLHQGIFQIVQTVLLLVAVLALAYLVYGGFQYVTAAGEERKVEGAKTTIVSAIIGILVIGLAYAIVTFVFSAVGNSGGGGAGGPVAPPGPPPYVENL